MPPQDFQVTNPALCPTQDISPGVQAFTELPPRTCLQLEGQRACLGSCASTHPSVSHHRPGDLTTHHIRRRQEMAMESPAAAFLQVRGTARFTPGLPVRTACGVHRTENWRRTAFSVCDPGLGNVHVGSHFHRNVSFVTGSPASAPHNRTRLTTFPLQVYSFH